MARLLPDCSFGLAPGTDLPALDCEGDTLDVFHFGGVIGSVVAAEDVVKPG